MVAFGYRFMWSIGIPRVEDMNEIARMIRPYEDNIMLYT